MCRRPRRGLKFQRTDRDSPHARKLHAPPGQLIFAAPHCP
ncbi:hypothetical protein HMPREF1545_03746 [Oscillibacter sp. KLE 1728]|nr:hypothetical protein HMPREF1545_03746 [Oscillibacter sp. KLE 1728]ERK64586.1 hypothetical protein HMPREF1546_01654 [Oscillibacter sp. KLE 1745]